MTLPITLTARRPVIREEDQTVQEAAHSDLRQAVAGHQTPPHRSGYQRTACHQGLAHAFFMLLSLAS